MVSKYREMILKVISDKQIKSTNEILKDLEKATGKTVNWHIVYRVLAELNNEGKIEKLSAKVGFFWRKRKE